MLELVIQTDGTVSKQRPVVCCRCD